MFLTATSILVFPEFLGGGLAPSNAFIVISVINLLKLLVELCAFMLTLTLAIHRTRPFWDLTHYR